MHAVSPERFRIRSLVALVVTLVALIPAFGCGGGSDGGGGGASTPAASTSGDDGGGGGDTLTMALGEIGTSIDPGTFQAASIMVLQSIEGPYLYYRQRTDDESGVGGFDPDNFDPGITEGWRVDQKARTLTMTLRRGVKSPYGNELTTADVRWTVERNIALRTIGADFFFGQAGIDPRRPITVIDRYTFAWNLERTSPNLLRALNLQQEAPFDSTEAKKHATSSDPWAREWLATHSAFFGPYTVTQFSPGQSITVETNPNYYGDPPPIRRIVMRAIPDPSTRQQLLQSGAVQYAPDIPRNQLENLGKDSSVKVQYGRSSRMLYLFMNTKIAPWNDPRVRQAVAAVLPAEQINQDAYLGTATLNHGPVSTLFGNYDPDTWTHTDVDLALARRLMAEAGKANGFNAELQFSLSNPGPENAQVAVTVQNALRQIGINVRLNQAASDATFFADLLEKKVPFGLGGAAAFLADAGYSLFNSGPGPSGFGNYTDPEFLRVVDEANSMVDGPERAALIRKGQELWNRDLPMYPILEPNVGAAMTPSLEGFNIQNTGFPLLQLFRFGS